VNDSHYATVSDDSGESREKNQSSLGKLLILYNYLMGFKFINISFDIYSIKTIH